MAVGSALSPARKEMVTGAASSAGERDGMESVLEKAVTLGPSAETRKATELY